MLLGAPLEHDPRHLRPAIVAEEMLARQPAADVQQGWFLEKGAAIVAAAVATGDEHRTDPGETNLAAMHVPGQHQIDMVALGPADRVRAVAQAQAKGFLWPRAHLTLPSPSKRGGTL